MALPQHLMDIALQVSQHEMGHYVVARALGFRTGDVTIRIDGPLGGHYASAAVTLPEQIKTIGEFRLYLERRVIVLYAGGSAESLPPRGPSPKSQDASLKKVDVKKAKRIIEKSGLGADQDYAKARELIHALRNVRYPDTDVHDTEQLTAELATLGEELFLRAVELVDTHGDLITRLAVTVASRVTDIKLPAVIEAAFLEGLPVIQNIAVAKP